MKIEAGKDNVVISDFDDLEVLKIAMKIEKEGIEAYKNAAEKVDNQKLKKTLLRLAEDEEDHLRTFRSMYESTLGSRELNPDDVDVEEGLFDYAPSGIFVGANALNKAGAVKDIVKFGLEAEMKTLLFYSEIYKKTENQKGKQKIKKIVDEEQMHYNILKSWEGICS